MAIGTEDRARLDAEPAVEGAAEASMWRRIGRLAAEHPLAVVVLVAAAARTAVSVASFVTDPDVLIGDEFQYLTLAAWISEGNTAESWQPGYGYSLFDSTRAFTLPISWLFDLFWPTRILGQLFAAAWGTLAAVLTAWMAGRLVGAQWRLPVGLVVALMPSQVLFSAVALRESEVWAALALVGAGVVLVATSPSWRAVALAIPAWLIGLLLLGWTRDQTALAAAWALVPSVLVAARGRRLGAGAAAVTIAVLVPIAGGLGPFGWDLVEEAVPGLGTIRTNLSLEAESAFTPTTVVVEPTPSTVEPADEDPGHGGGVGESPERPGEAGGTDVPPQPGDTIPIEGDKKILRGYRGEVYLVDDSARASLSALPRGLVAVLFRPLPWEANNSVDLVLAKFENVAWYGLYVLAAVGLVAAVRRGAAGLLFPLLSFCALAVSAALTQGNVGTAFRHRGQLLWAVVLLAAVGASFLAPTLSDGLPTRVRRWMESSRVS